MRIGTSREAIAQQIKTQIFDCHLFRLMYDPKDMIKAIIYSEHSPSDIFFSLCSKVRKKLEPFEATLKSVYVLDKAKKTKITMENSKNTFSSVLNKDVKLLFEINIRNKIYYFEATDD